MKKVIIIAEAGVNHNGDINTAKKLIDVAAEAGVDYVKFQSFKADKLVSPDAKKADYQIKNTEKEDDSQYQMLKQLELSVDDHIELIEYCSLKKINFFSTAFDLDGISFLSSLNLEVFKIPSGELTNFPYLKAVANTGLPVILSTGMANLDEIQKSVEVLISNGTKKNQITILHCNTEYPTPMIDVNLKAMLTIKEKLGVSIGYSDHTLGIEVAIAAVALGAEVIEKHFTLDRGLKGPDHKASLEPKELINMVSSIRNIEKAISGNGKKEASLSEKKNIHIARKSIHLSKDLISGSIINEQDIISLRPGDGICAMNWENVIGKQVNKDLKKFTKLTLKDLS
ncbi:N-acetylneuraminate synthase [Flavobacteriaceae bacterium]|nr:N-acetylneuraminate synthase [Flavobacteriaceae bacterium]MDA9124964.1 N-acetylneuraminate synthase [Flavobacteriaceae bacterium]